MSRRHHATGWLYVMALALLAAMLFVLALLVWPRCCCCCTWRVVAADTVVHDVPEPSTLALAGLGVVLVARGRRKQ